MQQLGEMTVSGAAGNDTAGKKRFLPPRILGDCQCVLCYADKCTVARLIKVGDDRWNVHHRDDSIRGQSNVRHERQLISCRVPQASGFSRAYCISFSVNEETISASASNKLRCWRLYETVYRSLRLEKWVTIHIAILGKIINRCGNG